MLYQLPSTATYLEVTPVPESKTLDRVTEQRMVRVSACSLVIVIDPSAVLCVKILTPIS